MFDNFPLLPEVATDWAARVDALNWFMTAHNLLFTCVVFAGVIGFSLRYRRRSPDERPRQYLGSKLLETSFTVTALLLWTGLFAWSAALYFEYASPPKDAMEVYVTGKQWMFHTQHPEGQREINELHVPINRPIKVTMTSEDVIHSFFIPAFRLKRDVLPGRYTSIWFNATKPGKYHLFCAEYCGAQHSAMGGWIYAMEPAEYEAWLSGVTGGGMGSMASNGEKLFAQMGCSSCHNLTMQGRCPSLVNVYGKQVRLAGGAEVLADDAYVRESILNPSAKVVEGYQSIMPTYQGQITEQNLLQLIAYVKSLGGGGPAGGNAGAGGQAGGIGQGSGVGQGIGAGRPAPGAAGVTSQGSRGVRDNKTINRGLSATQ